MIGNTKNSKKATVKGNKYSRRGLALIVAIAIIVIITLVNVVLLVVAKQTVNVIRVKPGEVLSKSTQISSNLCEPYQISKRDYTSDMALYKDKDKYYGMYATNYIRGGDVVHTDEATDEKPVRNAWLYSLPQGTEVITIPYTPTELAGKILVPGDFIKVRATYTQTGSSGAKQQDVVFDSVEVKDILNSDNQSVFDIYSQLNKLPDASRKKAMASSDFTQAIQPVSLMIAAPSAQANEYSKYKDQYKATFSFTLLSRNGNDSIQLDDIPIMSTDVDSWVKSDSTASTDMSNAGSTDDTNNTK